MDRTLLRFIDVDDCLCAVSANRHFARCLPNVNVGVFVYKQNWQWPFDIFIIVEDLSDAIDYLKWLNSR